jgi:hypothetical protein
MMLSEFIANWGYPPCRFFDGVKRLTVGTEEQEHNNNVFRDLLNNEIQNIEIKLSFKKGETFKQRSEEFYVSLYEKA